jgi:DNA-directed RNA polymerase specialized sigma24 family protein
MKSRRCQIKNWAELAQAAKYRATQVAKNCGVSALLEHTAAAENAPFLSRDSMRARLLPHLCHGVSAPICGAENSGALLAVQPETRDQVGRLVHKLCHDPNLYEELLQEALLCYWRSEVGNPGQTASWYRHRCRFCIQDYLKKGRSVDSLKHRRSTCASDGLGSLDSVADDDILQAICARDAFNELARRLNAGGQRTLWLLREELTLREIGRELHISHVAVIARRRHIAATAVGLGIHLPTAVRSAQPPPSPPDRRLAARVPASGSSKESGFPGYHLAPICLCKGGALWKRPSPCWTERRSQPNVCYEDTSEATAQVPDPAGPAVGPASGIGPL